MSEQIIDPVLVCVLLLNFFLLASTRLRAVVMALAAQGVLLAVVYPVAHSGFHLDAAHASAAPQDALSLVRLVLLTVAMLAIKGIVVPALLLRAVRQADVRWEVKSLIGIVPTLLIDAVGTGLALTYSAQLPLISAHTSNVIVPSALATVLTGFLMLTTRQRVLLQIIGYIVLENGIFIFGLLLIEAIPIMVEIGVLLDLFVGVFIMGIITHHISRTLPAASTEHLSALRE